MVNFYGSIEDLDQCLDYFSEKDYIEANLKYGECDKRDILGQEEVSGLMCGYAVIETNCQV